LEWDKDYEMTEDGKILTEGKEIPDHYLGVKGRPPTPKKESTLGKRQRELGGPRLGPTAPAKPKLKRGTPSKDPPSADDCRVAFTDISEASPAKYPRFRDLDNPDLNGDPDLASKVAETPVVKP
jgi:hypothetical protein